MENSNVTYIYDATIDNVLKDVHQEETSLIKEAYMNYLQRRYGNAFIKPNVLENEIKGENRKWLIMTANEKKSDLLTDKSFEELTMLSGKATAHARRLLYENVFLSVEEAEGIIAQMKEHYNTVKEFNKEKATWELSEGTHDCHFATGKSTNSSIRLSSDKPKGK